MVEDRREASSSKTRFRSETANPAEAARLSVAPMMDWTDTSLGSQFIRG